jgi:hypothetical protein
VTFAEFREKARSITAFAAREASAALIQLAVTSPGTIKSGVAAVLRFFGPAADAVKGELSKREVMQALSKAAISGWTTKVALTASLTAPEPLAVVWIPLAAAAATGILDSISRYHQGEAKSPESKA